MKGLAFDLLIVSAPYVLKQDAIKQLHSRLVEEMKSGVVILPIGMKADFIPKGTKIKVVDGIEHIVMEGEDETD